MLPPNPYLQMSAGTPCSLIIWLATGYSSMRLVPYPPHPLHDRLFKGFLKTKASDIKNHTKIWQDF
jgi:hypothetical protein